MESARIFRGWQGAAARHSGDYGEEPQRGQPRKRPPTSHANFRDTTLAAATATAQQDVPQRRTDAITAIRLDEMMLHVIALQPDEPWRAPAGVMQRIVNQVVDHIAGEKPGEERLQPAGRQYEIKQDRQRTRMHSSHYSASLMPSSACKQ